MADVVPFLGPTFALDRSDPKKDVTGPRNLAVRGA
jgi:hypothetical protein